MVKTKETTGQNYDLLPPSGVASTTATQTAELAVKYPRKKKENKKSAECFSSANQPGSEQHPPGSVCLTSNHREAGENL